MKKISLVAFLLISLQNFAQLNFNSPYSIFALGDVRSPGTVYNHSMGGVGVSNGNALYLNVVNPAMLTRNHTVIFDMAISSSYRVLKTEGTNQHTFGANFDGLQLGFPISPRMTTALGIVPFSTRSYEFNTTQIVDENTSNLHEYTGTGGLTKINWSTGYKLWKNKRRNTSLALGLEVAYIFGPMEEEASSTLYSNGIPNQYTASSFTRQSFSGFNFKPGLLFRREFNKSDKVSQNYKYNQETGDSTMYLEFESTLFSAKNIDLASQKMVVGKYIVLFEDREEVVVSKLFRGRKHANYLANTIRTKKPLNVGAYIRQEADEIGRDVLLEEFYVLLQRLENKQYTTADSTGFRKSYASRYLKKGSGVFFNLGATYSFQRDFSGKTFWSIDQYDVNGTRQYSDTVVNNEPTQFTMPSSFEFGISFDKPTPSGVKKNGKVKTSIWSIALDYSQYNWTEYRNPADLFNYDNSFSIKLGGEICPDISQKRSKGFGSQIFYRAGVFYNKSPHMVDGQELHSAGVNAGFGFPMYGTKELPRYINVMLGYARRGLSQNILIQEDYFNLSFSFSFNNKFAKRKAGL